MCTKITFPVTYLIVSLQVIHCKGLGDKHVTIEFNEKLQMYGLAIGDHFIAVCTKD